MKLLPGRAARRRINAGLRVINDEILLRAMLKYLCDPFSIDDGIRVCNAGVELSNYVGRSDL
jgi:hypothetical protein